MNKLLTGTALAVVMLAGAAQAADAPPAPPAQQAVQRMLGGKAGHPIHLLNQVFGSWAVLPALWLAKRVL